MSILNLIQHEQRNGVGSSQSIAKFLMENYKHIENYTMEAVAVETYTSKSTLVRFSQKLGYSGWRELVFELEHFVVNDRKTLGVDIDVNMPFTKESSSQDIIDSIQNLEVQTIKETAEMLSTNELIEAAEYINNADKIVIFGLSPNSYYGEIFKRQMITIGKLVIVSSAGENGIYGGTLTSNDVAIVISYSGNSLDNDPLKVIPILKESNVPIIGMTSVGNNYLRNSSDIVLTMSSHERLYTKVGTFATGTSVSYLLNVLYCQVFQLNYQKNLDYKVNRSKTLEESRASEVEDIIED